MMLGDLTVLVAAALVAELLADRPLEEALAALAADGAVVPAWNKTKRGRWSVSRFGGAANFSRG